MGGAEWREGCCAVLHFETLSTIRRRKRRGDDMATSWKGTMAALLAGCAIGVFLAPIIGPALARAARPATKAAMRAGIAIYDRGRLVSAELREAVEDAAAEVRAELASETPAAETTATAAQGAIH